MRDDRGHRAAAVPELLEELERSWRSPNASMNSGAIGSSDSMSSRTSPAATRCAIARCCAELDLLDEPRADPAEVHDADLAVAAACAASRRPAPARARSRARNASSAPSRSTSCRRRGEGLARGRAQEGLSELHAGGELALAIPALRGQVAHLARELCRPVVFLGGPERGGPAQPHVELQARVAERLGQRGELGEPLQAVALDGAACRALGRAHPAASTRCPAASRRRAARARLTRRTSSGAFAASALRLASIENRTHTARVPRGLRVVGEQGQALRGGLARQQQRRRSPRGSPAAAPA